MIFKGYSKTFSTENAKQYETIGAFWDVMSAKFGRDNLRGLGYHWTENSIEYVIGLKHGDIGDSCLMENAAYKEVSLPDEGWLRYQGKTEELSAIYERIYEEGALTYEIEAFDNDGNCEIMIYRYFMRA